MNTIHCTLHLYTYIICISWYLRDTSVLTDDQSLEIIVIYKKTTYNSHASQPNNQKPIPVNCCVKD